MVTFTISQDNNITAHATAEEARSEAGAITFDSPATLAEVSAEWPASRLVEIVVLPRLLSRFGSTSAESLESSARFHLKI